MLKTPSVLAFHAVAATQFGDSFGKRSRY